MYTDTVFQNLMAENSKLQALYEQYEGGFSEFSEDDFSDFEGHLHTLQSQTLVLRLRLSEMMTEKYKDNYGGWYFRSMVLRNDLGDLDQAFSCAKESIKLLSKRNEYEGVISRNYITLAAQHNEYELIDAEISRLANNPDKDSETLFGVVEDLEHSKLDTQSLSENSRNVLD